MNLRRQDYEGKMDWKKTIDDIIVSMEWRGILDPKPIEPIHLKDTAGYIMSMKLLEGKKQYSIPEGAVYSRFDNGSIDFYNALAIREKGFVDVPDNAAAIKVLGRRSGKKIKKENFEFVDKDGKRPQKIREETVYPIDADAKTLILNHSGYTTSDQEIPEYSQSYTKIYAPVSPGNAEFFRLRNSKVEFLDYMHGVIGTHSPDIAKYSLVFRMR